MDKIISARIDETIANLLDHLSRKYKLSKKKILENALKEYARIIGDGEEYDVFSETCGTWKRDERPGKLAEKARRPFVESMERHHR